MLNFNKKYGDYEIRTVDEHLLKPNDNTKYRTLELVKWVYDRKLGPICYTVAYFVESSEGYKIELVADRFFKVSDEDKIEIFQILKEGYQELNGK